MRARELRQNQETKAYYRLLRHLLTEEVKGSFKEEPEELTPRISELMRKLDHAPDGKDGPGTK